MSNTELPPFSGNDYNDWLVQTKGLYEHCKGYDMQLTKAQYGEPERVRRIQETCEFQVREMIAREGGSEKRRMTCEWTDSSDQPHKRSVWVWF